MLKSVSHLMFQSFNSEDVWVHMLEIFSPDILFQVVFMNFLIIIIVKIFAYRNISRQLHSQSCPQEGAGPAVPVTRLITIVEIFLLYVFIFFSWLEPIYSRI